MYCHSCLSVDLDRGIFMFGIVAINKNNVIGDKGTIPWHFSEYLKFFDEKTDGGTLIVGRKTCECLFPLANRTIIQVSKSNGCQTDIKRVLEIYHDLLQPVFVIGGASIFDQFMPYINTFFVVIVNNDCDGDTKMPESFDRYFEFSYKERKLSHDCELQIYIRKREQNFEKPASMDRQFVSWDQYAMSLAFMAAMKSKDLSSKVGATILGPDNDIRSLGYNGFPRGVDDQIPERYQRPLKYQYTCHAESNAIHNAGNKPYGCKMYITSFPCTNCTMSIIQERLSEVIVHPSYRMMATKDWNESWEISKTMLKEAGIKLREYDGPPLVTRIIGFGGEKSFCPNNWR